VTADGVVVWDEGADQPLYTKNPHERFAPASITKIMTAVVALERGDLEEVFPIETDAATLAFETESTTMGLYPGERLSLRNLLYGLMLPSGNDAAIEIARHIGGSESAFVELMNQKAAELGMANTRYMNPHGLDHDDHYTTAYDMTLLGRFAMRVPGFAEIVRTRSRVFYGYEGRKLYALGNLDRLIGRDGYDGIKIGFTENALSTYVGTAQRNGRRLYVTILHSRGWVSDGQRLFDHFFSQPAPAAAPRSAQSSRGQTPGASAADRSTGVSARLLVGLVGRDAREEEGWWAALRGLARSLGRG
ncbi:MAG TPA: D-alanyl-D-alanine carboxypeptidase family protein, partial [Dehalococcoidia bacterium]|nr:D-alanyl-D-alanine carboxypeptidase family protein [Dehalococcoidia bacterium]